MHVRALRRLLIVLLALTAAALLWNAFGMRTSLVIDGRSPYALAAIDDRASGGRSVAAVSRAGGALGLDCRIEAGYEWRFCELQVQFRRAPQGLDLSRFDSVRLWLTATGPEPQQRVRLYLRNFNPTYSQAGVTASEKVNQIVYEPGAYPAGYELPLSRLTVAQWWADAHPMSLALDAPEFSNVTTLAFSTGPTVQPGPHTIRIDRIELTGRLIPTSTFRLGIIAVWMLSVVGYLVADALMTRNQLRLSAASQSSLQRLNESLRLETRSLAEIARTDPLTGVLNRKGLADELTRLVRMGGDIVFPLTMVFIDIDHFKRVNDTHGHPVGDQVIRGLAELVRGAVQRDDLFARWGGEEFLLVFRNTSGVEGSVIAERLRERIAAAQWPDGLHVTCSFGVTEWQQDEDLDEGIRRADEAMYRAKQRGRDRVELELATGERVTAPDSQPA